MRVIKNIFLIILVAFFLIPAKSFSQTVSSADYNSWSAGIKFGVLSFYGDVRQSKYTTDNEYKKLNTGFTFEGTKYFNQVFGTRADYMFGALSGSSPNLNFHFQSQIKEITLSGIVNLNNLISFYPKKEKIINAYMYAGFGIINFNSKIYSYDGNSFIGGFGWDTLGLSRTKNRNEMVFPFGIGIKFKADTKIDLGLEITLHLTNTDKLDGLMVNKSYMDRYSYTAISITYKIGNKKEFVDWTNPAQNNSK